ncbi:MAG: phosphoribosylaminoimidazolesuccinocarboxamide synthase [Clostridiales bacterium]|nr:phosphoribosylaminoimidazolesuccinocarboxamide synthase [Clostridiales bacterium]
MEKQMLYEGKAKKLFALNTPDEYIMSFKDDISAFNGLKKGVISGKGIINNKISGHLMQILEGNGVPTHFIKELSNRDSLVRKVDIIPLEVLVRNVAASSLSKRLGLPEGAKMRQPVIEFCYKKDELGDPMINEYHILAMGFATKEELDLIIEYAQKINQILKEYFLSKKIKLIDIKLEFGRTADGKIILADEISPDTCRLWDSITNEKLDRDRFRRDLGNVEEAYNEIFDRLLG